MDSSSHASSALGRVSRVTNVAVKGTARETLESFGSVKVESTLTGAAGVVSIVDESSSSVAVDADRRVVLNIKTSHSGTSSRATSSIRVISVSKLSSPDENPHSLVDSDISLEGNSNHSVSSNIVDVDSLGNDVQSCS